jgi:pyridoxamine 5'-phosphate oxidase
LPNLEVSANHLVMEPAFLNDLDLTLNYLLQQCGRGAVDRKHELHQIYIATQNNDRPEIRTVILRSFDGVTKKLSFHTDNRSAKFQEIAAKPDLSILGYSRSKKYQIRFRGLAVLNSGSGAALASWTKLSANSRRCYMSSVPGEKLETFGSGLPPKILSRDIELAETEPSYKNFCSVEFKIKQIEWLYLSELGHRRALFDFNIENGSLKDQHWLCP